MERNELLLEESNMRDKLENAAPYNLFFSSIPDLPQTSTQENSITFTDLLCPTLGRLKRSLQINFLVDFKWLMEQYNARNAGKLPLTILYGCEIADSESTRRLLPPNVICHHVQMSDRFGTHHSKIGLYLYEDKSLRVVVSTANLFYEDWNRYNQGIWISPACPRLPEESSKHDGCGPTGFKTSLLTYLKHYNLPVLGSWIKRVKAADFSHLRVFLVTSMPGKHSPNESGTHVQRVHEILSMYCNLPTDITPQNEETLSWKILANASSIGSLGKTPADWFKKTFIQSLASHKQGSSSVNSDAILHVMYPSHENVMACYYGSGGGECLSYSEAVNDKQPWFKNYLHQWKADCLHRTNIMPHIKTYCRVSPCLSKLSWFLLTSANISKSAWGNNVQKDSRVYVRSYEAGVMFLPELFEQDYFYMKEGASKDGRREFPFIYDLPVTPYDVNDKPWCKEFN